MESIMLNTLLKSIIGLVLVAILSPVSAGEPDYLMGMTKEEFRNHINKIRAEQKGVDPSEVSIPVENNGYIEFVYEKYGQPGQRLISKKIVSSEESQYVMPSDTATMTLPNNSQNYTVRSGSDMLTNTGSTEGLEHRYSPPMEGLVNFATNTPWVHVEGEQEVVKREDNETTGWFLFRQFRNHVERSAQQFNKMSKQELDRTE
jgi:hypothetical protein